MATDDTAPPGDADAPAMIYPQDVLSRVGDDGWPTAIHCHEADAFYQRLQHEEPLAWETSQHTGLDWCSYCGSTSPQTILRLLRDGATAGGADWKYGWPHKFYLHGQGVPHGQQEWKNEHLLDLDDETFAQFVAILERYTQIRFTRTKNEETGRWDLFYRAPYRGYQAY